MLLPFLRPCRLSSAVLAAAQRCCGPAGGGGGQPAPQRRRIPAAAGVEAPALLAPASRRSEPAPCCGAGAGRAGLPRGRRRRLPAATTCRGAGATGAAVGGHGQRRLPAGQRRPWGGVGPAIRLPAARRAREAGRGAPRRLSCVQLPVTGMVPGWRCVFCCFCGPAMSKAGGETTEPWKARAWTTPRGTNLWGGYQASRGSSQSVDLMVSAMAGAVKQRALFPLCWVQTRGLPLWPRLRSLAGPLCWVVWPRANRESGRLLSGRQTAAGKFFLALLVYSAIL